jgi:putative chitinase
MIDYKSIIKKVYPGANQNVVDMFWDANEILPQWGINTLRRQASFLAHVAVETGGFRYLEENLNYSAQRLTEVWPNRFPTLASAKPYTFNPQGLANKVYNGRMGNRPNSMDGWIYRGRGLLQVTGKYNVSKIATLLGVDPEIAASYLTDPRHALEAAAATYKMLNVGPAADTGDMRLQTLRVNGGLNGLNERQVAYNKFSRALAAVAAPTIVGKVSSEPDADEDLKAVTVADLRDNGSRTINATDHIKQAAIAVGGSASAAVGAMSQASTVVGQVQSISDGINSGKGVIDQITSHWQLFVIAASLVVIIYFAVRTWQAASKAEAARVDDARTGVNLSR